jgi:hypothetical protein
MKKLFVFCTSLMMIFSAHAQCQLEVFDSMLFIDKPDMTQYGLTPIKLIGGSKLFPSGTDKSLVPADKTVINALTGVHDLTVLNIEHWQDTDLYVALLDKVHRLFPNLRVGYYSIVPRRDYWRAIQGEGHPKYVAWQTINDSLNPIALQADVIFPSLYTFYTDQQGWVLYATANLSEAKRYNKTVYAFIWPYYHDSTKLTGQSIPFDYWRLQLDTLKSLEVDGIVIWGGYKIPWDPQAGWWLETMDFMAENCSAQSG